IIERSNLDVRLGLFRAGAIRRVRSLGRERVCTASSGCRISDEFALSADEHRADAVFPRSEKNAARDFVPRYQREQFYRAVRAISERTRQRGKCFDLNVT